MIRKVLIGILVVVLLILAGGYAYYRLILYTPPLIGEADRAAITLMPLPAKLELNSGKLELSKGIKVEYGSVKNLRIENAVESLKYRIEKKTGLELSSEDGVVLQINCLSEAGSQVQQAKEDESYLLEVDGGRVLLEAKSPYGVLRGLETILQLVQNVNGSWSIPELEIEDNPRFPWRGLMLDVCRHWMPKDVVLRTIDAMATVKMNVFHWHLSEDQGFRVESKVFPKLHEIGSNGKYYTQEEVKEVIQYAAGRGIRVVPEFDLPGHSKSWQIAYPELSSVDIPLEFGAKKGILFAPPIDPTKENVYEFIDKFVGEMAALFPDPYFHIGGDEVNPKAWDESAQIQQFMKENGMLDHHDLQAYFNKRMHKILTKHGKLMLGWDEILHPDLGDDIIVQSWRSHKSLFEAVQKGGIAILSSGWYLDLVLHAEKHYQVDPIILEGAIDLVPDTSNWKMFNLTMEIMGNEMNSELVIFDKDSSNVSGFFAMMAERLAFKNGIIEGNELKCKINGPAGEMDYKVRLMVDSVNGKMSIGLMGFNTYGPKTGGSDIPGTIMPKIEIMKPLSDDEKERIIGGEACQWAEFVDSSNVESRLWPRAAAIAEKLWSPQELTNDIDDMYRRLAVVSDQLTAQGSMHSIQYRSKLRKLIPASGYQALKNLADVLEEVKYHSRMPSLLATENLYLPDFPLDKVVDAVRPESPEARVFNQLIDNYVEEKDTKLKKEIIEQLKVWQYNHELLSQYFTYSEKLQDVEDISKELSLAAEDLIALLDGRQPTISREGILSKLSYLEAGENGVIVAVVPGLRKLLIEIYS